MTHPYGTGRYARGLGHMGEPFAVPEWGSQVLIRPIRNGWRDAIGPYPLTVIGKDADLAAGLERLKNAGLVSVTVVVDGVLGPSPAELQSTFEVARPFKIHHLHDRALGGVAYGRHHRYEVKRAHARVEAKEIALVDHLDGWQFLYDALIVRHDLAGVHAFPAAHHETLAHLPGVRTFGGFRDGALVSAHLFVTHDGYAISHLAASTSAGYDIGAAYAVNDAALKGLGECSVINFGGGVGLDDDPSSGLTRFKKGFSNRAAAAYLCGKVLDPAGYDLLSAQAAEGTYFPAYRNLRERERHHAD